MASSSSSSSSVAAAKQRIYTSAEVARHCTATDLWLIYRGGVYDMTAYYRDHPGGDAMLRYAGKDVSRVLASVSGHNVAWSFVEKKLAVCRIGRLKQTLPPE